MVSLLVSSLMADRGLEGALAAAIASELQERSSPTLLKPGTESSVPLLQLVQQLINNSTKRKMATLKQVSAGWLGRCLIRDCNATQSTVSL